MSILGGRVSNRNLVDSGEVVDGVSEGGISELGGRRSWRFCESEGL